MHEPTHSLFIHCVLRRKNGGRKSSCLLLTTALPPTEWPQAPAWGSIPRFFFKYNHMFKLFGSCCHRQPNSREWAKETTPFVWEPAWAASTEAEELSLRPVSQSLQPVLCTPTAQTPQLRELTQEISEWHLYTTTVAWHSPLYLCQANREECQGGSLVCLG